MPQQAIVRVPYSTAAWADLLNTTWAMNHGAKYETDLAHWGVPEFWSYIAPDGFADCEDYALSKLRRLRQLGWPLGSLDLGICYAPDGSGHCVVIAHMDKGDYVLDIGSDAVTLYQQTPYRWLMVTQGTDLFNWVKVVA